MGVRRDLGKALFVAPVLAMGGYVAAGEAVAEKPQPIEAGKSYPLAAHSNCRYESGLCTLDNGDLKVSLRAVRDAQGAYELFVRANESLDRVVVSISGGGRFSRPMAMPLKYQGSAERVAKVVLRAPEEGSLRLALSVAGAHFFAETSTIFVERVLSFPTDNFSSVTAASL